MGFFVGKLHDDKLAAHKNLVTQGTHSCSSRWETTSADVKKFSHPKNNERTATSPPEKWVVGKPHSFFGGRPNTLRPSMLVSGSEKNINWLVVEPTHLKNMLVKMDYFPNFRGENSKNI